MEKAESTGRFLMLDKGAQITSIFPAEAAAISDVVIGYLEGTTAVLESFLTGTPGILIDTLEMYEDPVYRWGRKKVVFDNWPDLLIALDMYRCDHDAAEVVGFGDWTPFIDEFDCFRDGRAARRMGEYLSILSGAIRDGNSPDMAMKIAAKEYRRVWGGEVREQSK